MVAEGNWSLQIAFNGVKLCNGVSCRLLLSWRRCQGWLLPTWPALGRHHKCLAKFTELEHQKAVYKGKLDQSLP